MANPISVPGTVVPSGSAISPGGAQGVQGLQGGGGVDMQDPEQGIEWSEQFVNGGATQTTSGNVALALTWFFTAINAQLAPQISANALTNTGPENSIVDLNTGAASGVGDLTMGQNTSGLNYCIPIGLGIATWKSKVAIDAIITSTDALVNRFGLFRYNTTALYGGFFFEYDYSQSANWRCCVRTGTGTTNQTYADSGVAVAALTWFKFKVVTNATWTSFAFYINNSLVATITTNAPTTATDIGVAPHFLQARSAFAATRHMYLGYFYLNYPFTN